MDDKPKLYDMMPQFGAVRKRKMSVIINGMEMPKNCHECPLLYVTSLCDGSKDCPLQELVRCKYCRWGREACGNIECFVDSNIPPEYHGYEWFCPNGDRRSE